MPMTADVKVQHMATRAQSMLQEELVVLYLRLNGFFVSQFVVHSPVHGRNTTELDALAVRFPFNTEPERQVAPDPLLNLSTKYTDLVFCEVKSRGQKLCFNEALSRNQEAIESVLRWAGLFPEAEVPPIAESLCQALATGSSDGPATSYGSRETRIRALLFSPESDSRRNNQPWFVTGPELMNYVWHCLSPREPRNTCATTYDLQVWGRHELIVRYFKSTGAHGPGDINALYTYVQEHGL